MKLSLLEWITIAFMGFGIYHIIQLYWVDLPAFLKGEQMYVVRYDSVGVIKLSNSTTRWAYGKHPEDSSRVSLPVASIGHLLGVIDLKKIENQILKEGLEIKTYICHSRHTIPTLDANEEQLRRAVRGLAIFYSLSALPFIIFFGIRLIMMAWRRLLNRCWTL